MKQAFIYTQFIKCLEGLVQQDRLENNFRFIGSKSINYLFSRTITSNAVEFSVPAR